ncbi:hypothetical protein NDU88_007800 [Pleurodeles waltl]|uniref:Uncharacterized protein n=1 Tax=Pleurodeles waltl TaxID=8319 RepID=A0AAV7VQR0_PLEWA|nr:hypothetical protein NDU88_007800 [Pleurodeles waltl]
MTKPPGLCTLWQKVPICQDELAGEAGKVEEAEPVVPSQHARVDGGRAHLPCTQSSESAELQEYRSEPQPRD